MVVAEFREAAAQRAITMDRGASSNCIKLR
mgnify:CR=1 FL=1